MLVWMISMDGRTEKKGAVKRISSRLYDAAFFLVILLAAVFFPAAILVFPIWAAIEKRDTKYLRRYLEYVKKAAVYALNSFKVRGIWRAIYEKTIKEHFLLSKGYVKERLEKRRGKCLRCARCCKAIRCPLLEWDSKIKKWSCIAYGTTFWSHIHCSLFPLFQYEIDMYGCPGYRFEE